MSIKNIDRLGIKNFRSFDSDGIYLENLSKINLFIGKNNCGKSNVLKFLKIVAGLSGSYHQFPSTIENQFERNGFSPSIFFQFSHKELDFPLTFKTIAAGQRITHNMNEILKDPISFEFDFKNGSFKINQTFLSNRGIGESTIESLYQNPIISTINTALNVNEERNTGMKALENHFYLKILSLLKNFLSNIIYIPDFRIISEGNNKTFYNSSINGSNIISRLFEMQLPDTGEEENKKLFLRIQDTVREMIGINDLTISIPHNKNKMIIDINGNPLPLESFGSGIHETVLMCCMLIAHENHIALIEEPEIHLHPELQRKFFKFLQSTNNQYFITTHSNVFLDSSFEGVSIFHLKHDGKKTTLNRQETDGDKRKIVNDLGYKTSDLLQANGIIWVEGPSDRIFIKRWLYLKYKDIKEGIHYSIMFYGGKLLSHLTFEEEFFENNFIQLLRINKNSYIVIDRDHIDNVNQTKKRICEEIGESKYWITQGKEIENYLTKSTINNWLKEKRLKEIESDISKTDKLENVIIKVNKRLKYDSKKSIYSKEISEHITIVDLEKIDLTSKIDELYKNIKIWNK